MKKIELKKEDCAIIFRDDGMFEIYFPEKENNETMKVGEALITALVFILENNDSEFIDYIVEYGLKLDENIEDSEDNEIILN